MLPLSCLVNTVFDFGFAKLLKKKWAKKKYDNFLR